jgi:hypothetical protein
MLEFIKLPALRYVPATVRPGPNVAERLSRTVVAPASPERCYADGPWEGNPCAGPPCAASPCAALPLGSPWSK